MQAIDVPGQCSSQKICESSKHSCGSLNIEDRCTTPVKRYFPIIRFSWRTMHPGILELISLFEAIMALHPRLA